MNFINMTRYETEPMIQLAKAADVPQWVGLVVREFKPTPKFVKEAEAWSDPKIRFPYRRWPFVRLAYNKSMDLKSRSEGTSWIIEIAAPETLKDAPLTPMEHITVMGGIAPVDVWTHMLMRMGVIQSNQWTKHAHYEKPSGEVLLLIAQLLKKGAVPDRALFHVSEEQKARGALETSRRSQWVDVHQSLTFRKKEVELTVKEIEDYNKRIRESEKRLGERRQAEEVARAAIESLRETIGTEGFENIDSWRTQ